MLFSRTMPLGGNHHHRVPVRPIQRSRRRSVRQDYRPNMVCSNGGVRARIGTSPVSWSPMSSTYRRFRASWWPGAMRILSAPVFPVPPPQSHRQDGRRTPVLFVFDERIDFGRCSSEDATVSLLASRSASQATIPEARRRHPADECTPADQACRYTVADWHSPHQPGGQDDIGAFENRIATVNDRIAVGRIILTR